MTSTIFHDWLQKWDKELKRPLLLIDNCPAHSLDLPLNHIKVVFLPAFKPATKA